MSVYTVPANVKIEETTLMRICRRACNKRVDGLKRRTVMINICDQVREPTESRPPAVIQGSQEKIPEWVANDLSTAYDHPLQQTKYSEDVVSQG